MSDKFKPGDKATITGNERYDDVYHGIPIGEQVDIRNYSRFYKMYNCRYNGKSYLVYPSDLEPITVTQ